MDIAVFTFGQMVMDDVLDVGDVKAARCQVCGYEDIGRTIAEPIELIFALTLFQSTMETADGKALLLQIVADAFNSIAIVEKHDAAGVAEAKQ